MQPSDWGTLKEALSVNKDQIGIVFTEDKTLLGIDLDHCLNGQNIEHDEKEKIVQLIIEADTYTEISPSGTGLHLFLEIDAPLILEANRHGNFEAYTYGRYFTFTGNEYKESKNIRTVSPSEAVELLSTIGYPWGKSSAPEVENPVNTGDKKHTAVAAIAPSDLLKKIFASKGGDKIKALYNGDISEYKDDASSADMALLSHLAFWTKKNAEQMEQIWLSSPLGQREKTQDRQDYRTRTINTAIKNCTEVYESHTERAERAHPELKEIDLLYVTYKGEKIFTQNTENMCRILRHHPDFTGRFRYDLFKNMLEIKTINRRTKNDEWRRLEDSDAIEVQTQIQVIYSFFGKVGKEMIYDAIIKVSRENMIDSAVDYLTALKWDGIRRLDNWLCKTFAVPDNEYYRAVASNWMKGIAKRIMHPGCKFDYVLVLEGEQGTKKSTSLAVLGSPLDDDKSWHVETTMSTDNKDFFMQFEGKVIIEFSEGETLSRTEVKKMKAIITTPSDKYRPAYGRTSQDFPRRCVFAMTTNQTEYLKDETGNRRWLPVACKGVANIEWLKENRDQLYAEAYDRAINKKETAYEFPDEETQAMQSARRMEDPNADLVLDWFINKLTDTQREDGVTLNQVYRDAICGSFAPKPLDRYMQMNIGDILKNTLKMEKTRKRIDGIQTVRWFPTISTPHKFDNFVPTLLDQEF